MNGYMERRMMNMVLVLSVLVLAAGIGLGQAAGEPADKPSRSGTVLLPVLFYTPETRIAGGCLVNYFFREPGSADESRPSSLMPAVIYTQEQQISAEVSADLYWANERRNSRSRRRYPPTCTGPTSATISKGTPASQGCPISSTA
jgi:hypothetical protein